jgi:hypothetical protein
MAGYCGERDTLDSWNPPASLDFFGDALPLRNPDKKSGAFTDLDRLFTFVVPLLPEAIIQQLWE